MKTLIAFFSVALTAATVSATPRCDSTVVPQLRAHGLTYLPSKTPDILQPGEESMAWAGDLENNYAFPIEFYFGSRFNGVYSQYYGIEVNPANCNVLGYVTLGDSMDLGRD